MKALYRAYIAIFGSAKLAVVLLTSLLIAISVATRFEAHHGTPAVQYHYYRAWWFELLLALLALNLIGGAAKHYPWRRTQLGFVITHVGVLTTILGGATSRWLGEAGNLPVAEGEARSFFYQEGAVLTLEDLGEAKAFPPRVWPTHFDASPWDHVPEERFSAEGLPVSVLVDRYYPDADLSEEIAGDAPEPNPAADVAVRLGEEVHREWLLARDPRRNTLHVGPLHVVFREVESRAALEAEVRRTLEDKGHGLGVLRLEFADGALDSVGISDAMAAAQRVVGGRYRVTIDRYFSHFSIAEGEFVNASAAPRNPAVLFTVEGAGGSEQHLAFAYFPDFAESHAGAEGGSVRRSEFALSPEVSGAADELVVARTPNGEMFLAWTGFSPEPVRPLPVGELVTEPSQGLSVLVADVLERARMRLLPRNRSNGVRAPAVHAVLSDGNESQGLWIFQGATQELVLSGKPYRVGFGSTRRELPFEIQLVDFREVTYPGITMAESFESDVVVAMEGAPKPQLTTISMNNPLKHSGYTLFQSSFRRETPEVSIFSVARDPGQAVTFVGYVILITGVFTLFFLQKPLRRWEKRSLQRRLAQEARNP